MHMCNCKTDSLTGVEVFGCTHKQLCMRIDPKWGIAIPLVAIYTPGSNEAEVGSPTMLSILLVI